MTYYEFWETNSIKKMILMWEYPNPFETDFGFDYSSFLKFEVENEYLSKNLIWGGRK